MSRTRRDQLEASRKAHLRRKAADKAGRRQRVRNQRDNKIAAQRKRGQTM